MEVRRSPGDCRSLPSMTTATTENTIDTARIKRLIEFTSDVAQLADQRLDLDLRRLVDGVYRDLITMEEE